MSRIFNIGLPKTGTHSLHHALQLLGYRSLHNPLDLRQQCYEGRYHFDRDDWDALTNFGEHCYPQLDAAYPGSRFILTVRDQEQWLDSYARQIGTGTGLHDRARHINRRTWNSPAAWYRSLLARVGLGVQLTSLHVRLEVFGCYRFNRERCLHVYQTHYRGVMDYFRDRPNDLLVLNICGGEGWEKLCPFLDEAVEPGTPFPRQYVRQKKSTRKPDGHLVAECSAGSALDAEKRQ